VELRKQLATPLGQRVERPPPVFLPRLEQRELPFYKALDAGTVSEERRLFYVGLTRAKKHLLLTWDRNRKRSQFLDEIDPQSEQPARRGPRPSP